MGIHGFKTVSRENGLQLVFYFFQMKVLIWDLVLQVLKYLSAIKMNALLLKIILKHTKICYKKIKPGMSSHQSSNSVSRRSPLRIKYSSSFCELDFHVLRIFAKMSKNILYLNMKSLPEAFDRLHLWLFFRFLKARTLWVGFRPSPEASW